MCRILIVLVLKAFIFTLSSSFGKFINWRNVQRWAWGNLRVRQILMIHFIMDIELLDTSWEAVEKTFDRGKVVFVPLIIVIEIWILLWEDKMRVLGLFSLDIFWTVRVDKIRGFYKDRTSGVFSISNVLSHRWMKMERSNLLTTDRFIVNFLICFYCS